jgi:hypothetical protein
MDESQKNHAEVVELLLAETRKNIADENPNEALATLLEAVRLTRGEGAIMSIIDEAKATMRKEAEMGHEKLNEEDLIAAAQKMSAYLQRDETTILFESSRTDILRDAFEDGSSVVCKACGSLISRARAENHSKFWCEAVDHNMDEDALSHT